MKRIRYIFFTILILFSFVLGFVLVTSGLNKPDTRVTEAYTALEENHIVKMLDGKTAVEMIKENKTFSLMMGFSRCPWCQQLMPHYNKIAKQEGLKEIYYLDILDMRNNENSVDREYYLFLYEYCKDILDTGHDRIGAPTTIFVNNGVRVGHIIGTVDGHDRVNGVLPPLTTDQANELDQNLSNLFKLIK